MKLSKQELKQRISDSIKDNDDLVISLLEDIEDSMTETNESVIDETAKKELEGVKAKYEELKAKYKERFLKGDEVATETEVVEKEEVEEDEEEPRKYEDLFDEKGELK